MSAKKILIVEDEAKLSRVLQLELEHTKGMRSTPPARARSAWRKRSRPIGI